MGPRQVVRLPSLEALGVNSLMVMEIVSGNDSEFNALILQEDILSPLTVHLLHRRPRKVITKHCVHFDRLGPDGTIPPLDVLSRHRHIREPQG